MNVLDLGVCEYDKAFEIQQELVEMVLNGQVGDTLILVEHPPVITLGRNAKASNILAPEAELKREGIALHETNRGGDVTYHGPGQLVGYPIFNLKANHGGSIRRFVHTLEASVIDLLAHEWGIQAGRDEINAGVWIGDRKLMALGLAVRRGVTYHGFALNVSTNLDHYRFIVPCGLASRGVTSLERELGGPLPMATVKKLVQASFQEHFGFSTTLGEYQAI